MKLNRKYCSSCRSSGSAEGGGERVRGNKNVNMHIAQQVEECENATITSLANRK